MTHGILPLLKPEGMTSHDCVARLRRLTGIKKIGHTGTLDPDVTGVLPICFGQATRVVEYIQELPKQYEGELTLGVATDTLDASGNITETADVPDTITEEQVKTVFAQFKGEISQTPPMFSAVKVKGKRLYELARQGKQVERKSRRVTIYDLELRDYEWKENRLILSFRVTCSRGTYIRVLCEDIGRALGYPAHMSGLVRTRSGPYEIRDCVTFEEMEQRVEEKSWEALLRPIDSALTHLPRVEVPDQLKEYVYNGKKINIHTPDTDLQKGSLVRVYASRGTFLAIYQVLDTPEQFVYHIKPEKVFPHAGGSHS
ncbi:MAG: tRNA pseudouridine(55) synthase TruB [Bacillaceae bacterium]|nr:tRNA pseudouridine(55) synthase TruB [Bacillaceae bacterium]